MDVVPASEGARAVAEVEVTRDDTALLAPRRLSGSRAASASASSRVAARWHGRPDATAVVITEVARKMSIPTTAQAGPYAAEAAGPWSILTRRRAPELKRVRSAESSPSAQLPSSGSP